MKECIGLILIIAFLVALSEPQRIGQIAAGIQAGYEQARSPKPEAP